MAIHEKVVSHAVTVLRSNLANVNYKYIIRLTLESGWKLFMYFVENPPADNFLTVVNGTKTINAIMFESQYAHVYQVLQSEKQVFCNALEIFGVIGVNVTTEPELGNELVSTINPNAAGDFEAIAKLLAARKQNQTETTG